VSFSALNRKEEARYNKGKRKKKIIRKKEKILR